MGLTGEMLYTAYSNRLSTYLSWLFNIHVESNPLKDLKEPYLLLGNHVTNEDP